MKKKRLVGRIIKIVLLVLVLAVAAVGIYFYLQQQQLAASLAEMPSYSFREVEQGDIKVGVKVTGSISSEKATSVVLDWAGKVKEVNYEAGDIVQEGDVLAIVENDDLSSDITAASNSLRQQEINLQKQQDQLTQTIDAPATGRIKEMKARVGEDASSTSSTYGQLCWIVQDGVMELTVELDYETYVGYTFEVEDLDYNRYDAEVTAVNSSNAKIATMDVFTDELDPDEEVWVFYRGKNDTHIGEGKVAIKKGVKVTGSGKITEMLVHDGDYVTRGDTMFRLDTKDAQLSYESQSISVSDAQRKVGDLRKDLGKSDLPSPVTGVLTEINLLEGQNASSGMTVAKIQDHLNLQTIVNVDELDIAKIKVGQSVEITLEALEGQVYTGKVEKIAVIGATSNNFATYPVTISIDNPGEIKIGMSCEVTIEIESAKDVVRVPVEMLLRGPDGYSLRVVTDGLDTGAAQERAAEETSQSNARPQDQQSRAMAMMQQSMSFGGNGNAPIDALSMNVQTEIRKVEVGLINEDYAQILSGVEAGDWVATESTTTSLMDMLMSGGMGGGASTTVMIEGGEGRPVMQQSDPMTGGGR